MHFYNIYDIILSIRKEVILHDIYRKTIQRIRNIIKKGNKWIKKRENEILKKQNKDQAEVIQDLDRYNYRGQCETLKLENTCIKSWYNTFFSGACISFSLYIVSSILHQ